MVRMALLLDFPALLIWNKFLDQLFLQLRSLKTISSIVMHAEGTRARSLPPPLVNGVTEAIQR